MLFNSIVFAIFLPLVFFVYWSGKMQKVERRNFWLVACSLFFYGWWDVRFLLLLLGTTLLDFFVANKMERTTTQAHRKRWLFVSLAGNLGVLGFFKYFDFFSHSLQVLLNKFGMHADFVTLGIVLPVGLSFYTFQAMSYTIDVYQRKLEAVKNPLTYLAYISFFPQLVAGPIERAGHMLPQFTQLKIFNYNNAVAGLRLMLFGYFKKSVIADNLAPLANIVFDKHAHPDALAVMLGTIAFSIQIYCDFSGYTDIARGTARLFGFELIYNFRFPYFADSMRDFWHRWHISMSSWFRDYVYFPLGGNKKGFLRSNVNLLITFLVSGLWHGANWTFVAWGLWHGIGVTGENVYRKLGGKKFPKIIRHFLVVVFSFTSYIFLRSPSLHVAWDRLTTLFTKGWDVNAFQKIIPNDWPSPIYAVSLLFLIALLFVIDLALFKNKLHLFLKQPRWIRWSSYSFFVIILLLFGIYMKPPAFIYFQF